MSAAANNGNVTNENYAPRGVFRNQFQQRTLDDSRLYGSQGSNSSAFHKLYGSQMSMNQQQTTEAHRQTAMANNNFPGGWGGGSGGGGGEDFGNFDVAHFVDNPYSSGNNNNDKYAANRKSEPYSPIPDGNQNFAFTYDVGDGNLNAMGIPQQHQQQQQRQHPLLRQTHSDTADANDMQKRRGLELWRKTEEQLNLRRRLPKSDIQALLDAMGHGRLQRMRSSSRRQQHPHPDDTEDDLGGDYIPSPNSIKRRTLEPPPRSGARDAFRRDADNRESEAYSETLDLSEFFRSGSSTEKTWGKQLSLKK